MTVPFRGKFGDFGKAADDAVIVFGNVGHQAVGAVLDPLFGIAEIPPAALPERIKRTVAEQTVEPFRIRPRMAGKKFTFPVAEKPVMIHKLPLFPL